MSQHQEILNAIPADAVQEAIRNLVGTPHSEPTRKELEKSVKAVLERLIFLHRRVSTFSRCDEQDIQIVVDGELKATDVCRASFKALTPQGAVFLGELAAAGFFGAETQQELAQ